MIQDFGNCGHINKMLRIMKAFRVAQENKCALVVVLDPLCYDSKPLRISSEDLTAVSMAYDKDTLYISVHNVVKFKLPWWDIVKVSVVW
jgi:hypothetical protein